MVSSPDPVDVQQAFREERGWGFPMVSVGESAFARDNGFAFEKEDGDGLMYWPGVSTFQKRDDGTVVRCGQNVFGPGDPFCALWHLLDLLPEGKGDWDANFQLP